MKTTRVFDKLYMAARQHPRYISSCGGARSSKTFSALELLYFLADRDDQRGDITSVVAETMPNLKRGAIRDFQNILGDAWNDNAWNKTECTYTMPNGAIIEFFSADSPGKVHGPQRKRLFVNEVQNVGQEVVRQLAIRTRGLILLDYNPTRSFYVNEEIETRPDCVRVHSTYLDNPFLSPEQVAEIESNRHNENWWRVYGLGEVGRLDGLIFPDFELVDELPADGVETYGMDYGFTNDPSTLIHTRIDTARRIIYWDEVFCRKGMLNADMAADMRAAGVTQRGVPIYGDAAEPKTIADLCGYGYNVKACYKATRKAEQLQTLRGYTIRVTKRSLNLIRELRGYTWAMDRNGQPTNEPIAYGDHCIDAARYSVVSWLYETTGHGNYIISYR